ncbi:MAG: hypothetical protein Unbinned4497contig1000_5 [Prokaryotic dsDNA virus sp.]|nr:MAG: hypothetical protein Unbinned4497contig1000_5 [Prokaryotic dsDNA virus sp.]|tara:strand:+ start:655 stop:1107 length:453 start_codon:yes stop_codon:yes gene_type:complete
MYLAAMYKVEIEVSGQPIGKARPRFVRSGKTYTPAKTVDYERRIHAAAWAAMVKQDVYQTLRPVSVEVIAFMQIPTSWSKVKQLHAEYNAISHTSKPDLDNIVKVALDGLQGTLFKSDAQVTSIKARKMFCHPDRGAFLYMAVSWTEEGE